MRVKEKAGAFTFRMIMGIWRLAITRLNEYIKEVQCVCSSKLYLGDQDGHFLKSILK
ncbi:hypothetical protein KHA80_12675 [Anaerobacillus sp. HL2]|nr:hypothetical protein KHA80_12675 [Anaerobacillus sp. HL2]